MPGMVRIAVLIVRITGCHPVTMPMGRITVIAANPDILIIAPFVVTGNPDGRMIRTLPLLIIVSPLGRSLRTDMDGE